MKPVYEFYEAVIARTGSELDGVAVYVTGMAVSFEPLPGSILIIERIDGQPFHDAKKMPWKNILMSEACLDFTG